MEQQFNHGDELAKMIESMPAEMRKAFQQVVMAGKKVLYSQETAPIIDEVLNAEGSIGEKLGAGIANLVVTLDNKANGAMPKDVIIPAATVLLFDAADALAQAGMKIATQDIAVAYETMFYSIFQSYGAAPEQVDQVMDRLGQDQQAPAPEQGLINQGA